MAGRKGSGVVGKIENGIDRLVYGFMIVESLSDGT
jgi:hypothetical protein